MYQAGKGKKLVTEVEKNNIHRTSTVTGLT